MSGCGSGACGCAGTPSEANAGTGTRLARYCPKCSAQAHPVNNEVLGNILKADVVKNYSGETPNLCLNPSCDVAYFDPNTNEIFYNGDCAIGIWFKDNAQESYICYCEKVTEKEITKAVVETGMDDLGSVMLYLRESIGEECEGKQAAAISCNRYFQDAIEKAQIIRQALTEYKDLQPNSKDIPYQMIEERYNKYLLLRSGNMAEEVSTVSGGGCCGGGCG